MKSRLRSIIFIVCIQLNQGIIAEFGDKDGNNGSGDQIAMIHNYIRLAVSIIHQGYDYLTKGKADYDLQGDVLDNPYKNMVYRTTQSIEQLFNDATAFDNPPKQIKALILLCRMPVPEWYLKSFQKGLVILYKICFDEQGNFKDAAGLEDIRLVFKDYCRKTPTSWQDIAGISPWWCKNKKPYPVYTKYYADTCTDHNEDLLQMVEAGQSQNLIYLKYLLQKNGSPAAHKIYDYYFYNFLKSNINEFDSKNMKG